MMEKHGVQKALPGPKKPIKEPELLPERTVESTSEVITESRPRPVKADPKAVEKPEYPSFMPDRPLTEAERFEIAARIKREAQEEKNEKLREKRRAHMKRIRAIRDKNLEIKKQQKLDGEIEEKNRKKKNRKDIEALKTKVKQGLLDKAGLPAIKPLSWLKDFRTEYEVSADDLRRLCMAFIFGHSIDELKLMTSPEHSHEVPVIVYYFARCFIADTESGVNDAMEKLLDRIFGKTVQKEVVINANLDLNPKKDTTAEERRAELSRLEQEVSKLMKAPETAIDVEAGMRMAERVDG